MLDVSSPRLPHHPRARGAVLVAISLLLATTACATGNADVTDDDAASPETTEEPTTTTTEPPTTTTTEPATTTTDAAEEPDVSLTIEVASGERNLRRGTLTCGDTAVGTGHLEDPGAATAACAFVDSEDAKDRLIGGYQLPGDVMCTMQYFGPEVATVTGTVDDRPVDTSFTRHDGCAEPDFRGFEPLIGSPE